MRQVEIKSRLSEHFVVYEKLLISKIEIRALAIYLTYSLLILSCKSIAGIFLRYNEKNLRDVQE